MNVIRQEIRTGLLVVVSLAILIGVVLYLGAPGVFVPQKTYYIYVENAGGLKQGADVALAGRKIGQVVQLFSPVAESERPAPKYETKVEVRVIRIAKIYKNAKVQITSASLLGEMFIDFTMGQEASGLAPGMSSFEGTKAGSLSDAVPILLEKLDPVMKEATATMQVLQKAGANVDRLTSPGGDFPKAIAEFRQVGEHLNETTGPNGPLQKTLVNVGKLTAEDGKISLTLDNLQGLLGPDSDFAKTMKNTEKFTEDLSKNKDFPLALANARKATEELNSTLSTLRFQFSTIAGNLEQASDTVKRQPWRLIWPSTKKYDDAKPAERVEERKPAETVERKPVKKRGR
ncbi:MAG TPA: MlaD family protein [Chthoniobacteraceae bacterium]|jgi:phospholipid/cholesterol/gamma-HCH transport system substrate-binding protein|nr:MlaD family protein [Chthoniobacteraceae bacterium]